MSRIATGILFLVAVLAAVFLFAIEPRLRSTREILATRDYVLSFAIDAVKGVRIVNGDDVMEISRSGEGWKLGPVPADRASTAKVLELLRAAQNLRVHDVIGGREFGENLTSSDLGVSNPKNFIDILGDGDARLAFGKEAAGEGRVYVRQADSKEVYVVDDDLQELAFQGAQAFRDRRMTDLTPGRIDRVILKRGLGEIELARGAKGWEIVRPLRARADDKKVHEFLDPVLSAEILEFVDEQSDASDAGGLAEPKAELTWFPESGGRPQTLRLGGEIATANGPALLAEFSARKSVYHLPASLRDLFDVTPEMLRDRRFLDLNPDTIDAIRFRNPTGAFELKRSEDAWQVKGSGTVISDETIEGFVNSLAGTEVSDYLPATGENLEKFGFDKPAATLAFDAWLSENTPETAAGRHPVAKVTIGTIADGKAYVRVDDDPEICVVPASAVERIPADPEQLAK